MTSVRPEMRGSTPYYVKPEETVTREQLEPLLQLLSQLDIDIPLTERIEKATAWLRDYKTRCNSVKNALEDISEDREMYRNAIADSLREDELFIFRLFGNNPLAEKYWNSEPLRRKRELLGYPGTQAYPPRYPYQEDAR